MNKSHTIGLFLVLLVFSVMFFGNEEVPIKEGVSVVNVEVPVRVFAEGKAVPGLEKDDFQVFEDGKAQVINGFYMLRKKLSTSPTESNAKSGELVAPGRYFVLVFRTYEYNQQLQDSLDYLFRTLLRPDDQLLVLANNRYLNFVRLENDEEAQNKITEVLKTESLAARNQMLNYLKQIEQSLDMTKFRITLGGRADADLTIDYITNFLQNYLRAWKDFKRRYLRLDIDKYYDFSRHLERVKKDKWVLNFYQLEQFPQIAFSSEIGRQLRNYIDSLELTDDQTQKAQARIIYKLTQDIESEINVADDFPSEEVSKLFYKVNATFHSFFMRIFKDTGTSELQFRNVATDIENSLRLITSKTGGELLASNDLTKSLQTIVEKEDLYYMLTYEPGNAKKIGKIKVTVKNKKYDVMYDNNMRADYINEYLQLKEAENPSVKIKDLSFKDKKLSLSINDFSLTKIQNEKTGLLHVRIRLKNSENQTLFDQNKVLKAPKSVFSLSLNFNFLTAGKYDIIVDVLDQVSGKSCTEIIQPLIE